MYLWGTISKNSKCAWCSYSLMVPLCLREQNIRLRVQIHNTVLVNLHLIWSVSLIKVTGLIWKKYYLDLKCKTGFVVFLPGESQGRGSLVGCCLWDRTGRTWLSDFTFIFHFHAMEKEMGTHSSVLVWRIPATGEPGRLPSMGSHRVGHDWSNLAAAAAAAAAPYIVILKTWLKT